MPIYKNLYYETVNRKNSKVKQKAVFLDRDGTINKYVGYLCNVNEFELIPGVAEAIKKIHFLGYLAIVVTNQSVIARGKMTFDQLKEIHRRMIELLNINDAYIDAIYFCPHYPQKGVNGGRAKLSVECECRKPKSGMLIQAAKDYNIDLSKSWMVGDSNNDIIAGISAGCSTVLLSEQFVDFGQSVTTKSLLTFATEILQ